MKALIISILTLLFCANIFAQSDFQDMLDAERAFEQAAADKGTKSAFLNFLADDSVIFRPGAVNGKEFWKLRTDSAAERLVRRMSYTDIASNGLLGYTTGSWELYSQGQTKPATKFGQYVTIWEKRPNGFRATVDIVITHDKVPVSDQRKILPTDSVKELNERGWSPADASMNFLRTSMTNEELSGAYKKFAAEDVRLLRDREPPIIGKKNVVSETKNYKSVSFPQKVAMLQSADMAYTWNPCKFENSNEGTEEGNCLHVWKLRDKKWWIVLGVFAPAASEAPPKLKTKSRGKNP
jgi:hypothetical protein